MRNGWMAGTRFVQDGFHCWCCAPNESLAVIITGYVNGPSTINLTIIIHLENLSYRGECI